MTRFLDKLNAQIHETELQLDAHIKGLHVAKRNGDPEDDFIFNEPSEIYREPDETSAVAFDGNELPF